MSTTTRELGPDRTVPGPELCYFPSEGFGETYRRVMVNRFFESLLARTSIRTVAEYPLDSYGVVGAGSLVFAKRGCKVVLVSDQPKLLDQAAVLYRRRSTSAHFLQTDLRRAPVVDDAFDLCWNFDRVQTLPDPSAVLQEMARVSKMLMVMVPNARNYGQYLHWGYHKLTRSTCDYVGPRRWMCRTPVRKVLVDAGLEVVEEGLIDVPWWPGFPELPDLVRRTLRLSERPRPPDPLNAYPNNDAVERAALRSAFIEDSKLPEVLRRSFAHNLYVLAVKPAYRSMLAGHPSA